MHNLNKVQIRDKIIGEGEPCFIIAEAGVNHNGDVNLAKKLIDVAKEAGADAVKFQTFKAEEVITKSAEKARYQKETTGAGESQFDMIKKLELAEGDFENLFNYAQGKDIVFLSTPYDKQSVDLLVRLGVPALKISSADINHFPLLRHIASKKKPIILSTGMATLAEVERALGTLRRAGSDKIILLHCVTNYPLRDNEVNLLVMDTLAQAFHVPVGFSDHTTGRVAPITAVARGACMIEKHLTLDRGLPGPDHAASLDPVDFKAMVDDIRTVESVLGSPVKMPLPVELENRIVMGRSVVAAVDLPAGTVLKSEHLALKRPGDGLDAGFMEVLLGRQLVRSVPRDDKLSLGDVKWT